MSLFARALAPAGAAITEGEARCCGVTAKPDTPSR